VAVRVLQGRIGQRKPGFSILPMDNQSSGIRMLPINEEDNHLAVAVICTVVRAGTICMSQASHLQIKRLHNAKAGTGQLLIDEGQSLIADLIKSQKWNQGTHFESCSY